MKSHFSLKCADYSKICLGSCFYLLGRLLSFGIIITIFLNDLSKMTVCLFEDLKIDSLHLWRDQSKGRHSLIECDGNLNKWELMTSLCSVFGKGLDCEFVYFSEV